MTASPPPKNDIIFYSSQMFEYVFKHPTYVFLLFTQATRNSSIKQNQVAKPLVNMQQSKKDYEESDDSVASEEEEEEEEEEDDDDDDVEYETTEATEKTDVVTEDDLTPLDEESVSKKSVILLMKKLVKYRLDNFEKASLEMSQKWNKKEISVAQFVDLTQNNIVTGRMQKWGCEELLLETCSIDDQITLSSWYGACIMCQKACNYFVQSNNVFSEIEACIADVLQAA